MKPITNRGRCWNCAARLPLDSFIFTFENATVFNEYGDMWVYPSREHLYICSSQCAQEIRRNGWGIATQQLVHILLILNQWLEMHEDMGEETQSLPDFVREEYPDTEQFFTELFTEAEQRLDGNRIQQEPEVQEVRPLGDAIRPATYTWAVTDDRTWWAQNVTEDVQVVAAEPVLPAPHEDGFHWADVVRVSHQILKERSLRQIEHR